MPEFILKGVTREFHKLDQVTRGYIEALFFTSCGVDDGELADKGFTDLSDDALAACVGDCHGFYNTNRDLIIKAMSLISDYDLESIGRDFWYTRNHHGVGFWDRGLDETGEELTQSTHDQFNETYVYLGDDGKVYLA